MDLNQRIQDEIKKSLPEEVGKALRERLAQADNFEHEMKSLTKDVEALNKKTVALEAGIKERDEKLKFSGDLAKREADVSARERKIEVEVKAIQLQCAGDRISDLKELMHAAFRNPEFIRHESGYRGAVVKTQYGEETRSLGDEKTIKTTQT